MVLVSRIVTALLLGLAGYRTAESSELTGWLPDGLVRFHMFGVPMLVGAVLGWLFGSFVGHFLKRTVRGLSERSSERSGAELVLGAVGMVVGLAVSALLAIPLLQLEPVGRYLLLPVAIVVAFVGAEIAASRQRDILRLFGVRSGDAVIRSKLLDTSAIIDGRVADVAAAGFIEGELVVPVFVLEELQRIADSDDPARTARGRRGLGIVTSLRKARRLVTVDEDIEDVKLVDHKLVRLAVKRGWSIVTNDVNLERNAQAQGVRTLNVNALADSLKPAYVAGDSFRLKVLRTGKESGQGVGYLDDGTMVVVDGGAERIGSTVPVEVSTVLQTPTGKLVFARLGTELPDAT